MHLLTAGAVLTIAYLAGAIPFSNLAARRTRGVDLRHVGSGTVSGTSLYEVAGFAPLAAAGVLEVGKGAVGPLLAGRERPTLAALAGSVAVAGHNWSPFLRGAGGRGLSPALGALLVQAPAGVAVLGSGMAGGRIAKRTGLGVFLALSGLVPLLARIGGRRQAVAGGALLVPLLAKRLTGNQLPPAPRPPGTWRSRLLYDRDPTAPGEVGAPASARRRGAGDPPGREQ